MMLIAYNDLHTMQLDIVVHAMNRKNNAEDFAICPACMEIYEGEDEYWCACDYD